MSNLEDLDSAEFTAASFVDFYEQQIAILQRHKSFYEQRLQCIQSTQRELEGLGSFESLGDLGFA